MNLEEEVEKECFFTKFGRWSRHLALPLIATAALATASCSKKKNSIVGPENQPPETTIISGPSGTVNTDNVTFKWKGEDEDGSVEKFHYFLIKSDSLFIADNYTEDKEKGFSDLEKGDYTFAVSAIDDRGGIDLSPATSSFTIGVQDSRPSKIAFTSWSREIEDHSGIYIMDPDGKNITRLTEYNGYGYYFPSWSPDGKKIAFDVWEKDRGIHIMNSDGSNQINITNNTFWDSDPSWSPDGSKIVFASNRDGDWEIYTMNSDGSNQVNITNNHSSYDNNPSWSPDGSKIAFNSGREHNDLEIYVMNPDGSNQINITNHIGDDMDPAWSPDGTKIVFSSYRDGDWEIYTMNSDGSNQVNITNNHAIKWDVDPSWSPDGKKIVFSSYGNSKDNPDIFIMNANGTNKINLTNNPLTIDQWPAWSPYLDK